MGKLKVLLVEDHVNMSEIIRSVLSGLGVGHLTCEQSVDAAWQHLQETSYDLVIIDRNLNGADGFELLRRLRRPNLGQLAYTPVLMLTASGEHSTVQAARDAGANEYLVKPFTVQALALRLSAILEQPRAFVQSATYFGPDRRRRNDVEFRGPDRRRSPR